MFILNELHNETLIRTSELENNFEIVVEPTKWVAVAKNDDGEIFIFHDWIYSSVDFERFCLKVERWRGGLTVLAMFKEEDVVEVCSL